MFPMLAKILFASWNGLLSKNNKQAVSRGLGISLSLYPLLLDMRMGHLWIYTYRTLSDTREKARLLVFFVVLRDAADFINLRHQLIENIHGKLFQHAVFVHLNPFYFNQSLF